MKGDDWGAELRERTKKFAHRCVKLATALPNTPLGRNICDQLIRCSTSTASNYRAACLAQSKAAFNSKLSIVLEECDESWFWIEFAIDETLILKESARSLLQEAQELTNIFAASRRTSEDRND